MNHFDTITQGEGQGDEYQDARDDGEEEGAEPRYVLGPGVGHAHPGVVIVFLVVLVADLAPLARGRAGTGRAWRRATSRTLHLQRINTNFEFGAIFWGA